MRQGIPAGTVHLALDETMWSAVLPQGGHVVELTGLTLPVGTSRLEARLQTDADYPGARHGRFIPALYVEVTASV
jgi:hypothetical protein